MGLLENTIGAMIGRNLGGGGSDPAPQPSSGGNPYGVLATALIGLLAAKAMTGGFSHSGGQTGQPAPAPAQPPEQAGPGGLLSGLGGLLSQFQNNGHGNLVNSWVGAGENAPATPGQISQALGPETVNELAQRTGVPAEQIASQLSQELPGIIDKLTPNGRLPTHDESSAWR